MGNRTTLNRALSKLGLCSRTDAIKYIQEGKVTVNNRVTTKSLAWVDIELDKIAIHQSILQDQTKNQTKTNQNTNPHSQNNSSHQTITQNTEQLKQNIYLALYKPKGYITTKSDEHGRKTVYDLLPAKYKNTWIFPVGRLDKDSQGLLLFTNDGTWQDYILAPNTHLKKTYLVWTEDPISQSAIAKLEHGIRLSNHDLQTCTITPHPNTHLPQYYEITISEGKNRQIRKMMEYVGTTVTKLERIKIGNLSLEKLHLQQGEVKEIDPNQI